MRTITLAFLVICAASCTAPASAVYHKVGGSLPDEMVMDAWVGEGHAFVDGVDG